MLLKFTTADMLNTSLIDVATGERAYNIVTVLSDFESTDSETVEIEASQIPSVLSASLASSSQSPTPTMASSSPAFAKQSPAQETEELPTGESRRTTITDVSGNLVADIEWKGRRPTISLYDEKVGALTDLFGSSTIRFMLVIDTRSLNIFKN